MVVRRFGHGLNKLKISIFITIILVLASIPFILSGVQFNHLLGGGGGPGNEQSAPVYDNLSSLKGNSTIVALVGVTKLNSTYCDSPHTGCLAANFVFQVNVTSYVKGSGPTSIYVGDYAAAGDPLLVTGDQYVLFLTNDWNCAPSPPAAPCVLPPTPLNITYHIVGGPQGKFLLQNGFVSGFKTLYPQQNNWIRVDANSVPLSQFIAKVQSA